MNVFEAYFFLFIKLQYSVSVLKGISIFPIVVCDKGTFGLEGKTFCGRCRDKDECDPVNGSCPNGCQSGATGFNCKIGT